MTFSRDTTLKNKSFDVYMAFNGIFPKKNMSFDVHVELNYIFLWHALKTCNLMYVCMYVCMAFNYFFSNKVTC